MTSALAKHDLPGVTEVLVDVQNLDLRYGAVHVLEKVSLTVPQSSIVGVAGPSAVGKTSLLRAISGYLPFENPTVHADRMTFGDVDLQRLTASERARRGIGFVPERNKIIGVLSVADNIVMGCSRAELRNGRAVDKAVAIFPELAPLLKRKAGLLSGGERQMLAIAGALAHDPRVLIIDELSLGLAPVKVEALIAALQRLSEDGLTLIIAEQNPGILSRLAQHVCLISTGGTSTQGSPETLLQESALLGAMLGEHHSDQTTKGAYRD